MQNVINIIQTQNKFVYVHTAQFKLYYFVDITQKYL